VFSKLYVGCMRNAVWHVGSDAFNVIDKLAVSGQYPYLLYARPGQTFQGMPIIATLKGRPVIPLEVSPAVGTAGDVILADWSQYVLTYMQYGQESPLSFGFAPPQDQYHSGMVGLREGAVEARISDEILFSTDSLMLNFKFRGDGNWLWPRAKQTQSNLQVGPAVILV
jgi:hypothetical protein